MIYDMVMKVVKPPNISVRIEVLFSSSLKKRFISSLIFPLLLFKLNQAKDIDIRVSLFNALHSI